MKYRQGDFVLCIWKDAHSIDEWTERKLIDREPPICHSVGMVVDWTPRHSLTLALNHNTNTDELSCVMCIPSGMISSIKKLE